MGPFTRSFAPRHGALAALVLALAVLPAGLEAQQQPVRSGFTLMLGLGMGLQDDGAAAESQTGVGGLNLGIGGFLNERVALWFRVSGTTATYDTGFGDVTQTSGFAGPAVQYWANERFSVEGGVGAGFWDLEGDQDSAVGLLLAASYVFWTNGGHNLGLGFEYAPAFTDPATVHNYGLVLTWQLN